MKPTLTGACALLLVLGCPADDDSDDAADDTGMNDSGPATSDDTSSVDAGSEGEPACPEGETPEQGTGGSTEPLQQTWGAACNADADCVALLGEGATCLDLAVVYELPGGYCTKPCTLPDSTTTAVLDDLACDPAGGVACVGQKPLFEYCAVPCDDHQQCDRPEYMCRRMPTIAKETDPALCLMPDCCLESCSSE
jgi:hypothetical protein